jgi:hypothetical protein
VKRANLGYFLLLGAIISICAGSLSAAPAGTGTQSLKPSLIAFSGWAAADLDADRKPDVATAGASRNDGSGYAQEITVRLSSIETRTIAVRTAIQARRLSVRDLDGDADFDLVLESFEREPLAILLNDGGGHFHQGDLDEFRAALEHDPYSLEAPVSPSALPDIGGCPSYSLAAPGFAGFQPDPAARKLFADNKPHWPVLRHSIWSSRGPPRSF